MRILHVKVVHVAHKVNLEAKLLRPLEKQKCFSGLRERVKELADSGLF